VGWINKVIKQVLASNLFGLSAVLTAQASLKQTGLFLKNNKPKPFDSIIREICHPLDSLSGLFATSIYLFKK